MQNSSLSVYCSDQFKLIPSPNQASMAAWLLLFKESKQRQETRSFFKKRSPFGPNWSQNDDVVQSPLNTNNTAWVILHALLHWQQHEDLTKSSWPAISDIWLGIRTVPVLSVAKEVAAPARSPTGRGAPEHRQVDADWLIDDRVSRNFWVLSVCWCFLLF